MSLLKYRERIHTECSLIGKPVLNVKAIKVDANGKSLKQQLGCKSLKSCDYFKFKKNNIYFIEISDFDEQLINLSKKDLLKDEKTYIKMEIKLKISDSLLIYEQLITKYYINSKNKSLKKKVWLTTCKEREKDMVTFAFLERELSRSYTPLHFAQVKVVPYTWLEKLSTIK